jgi:hypothetical protein
MRLLAKKPKMLNHERIYMKGKKRGATPGDPGWRCVFKSLTNQLARDSEITSIIRCADGPASRALRALHGIWKI